MCVALHAQTKPHTPSFFLLSFVRSQRFLRLYSGHLNSARVGVWRFSCVEPIKIIFIILCRPMAHAQKVREHGHVDYKRNGHAITAYKPLK